IQEAASQPRALKNGGGAGTDVVDLRRFLEHTAERSADVHNVAANNDLSSDRTVQVGWRTLPICITRWYVQRVIRPVEIELCNHARPNRRRSVRCLPSYAGAQQKGCDTGTRLALSPLARIDGRSTHRLKANSIRCLGPHENAVWHARPRHFAVWSQRMRIV